MAHHFTAEEDRRRRGNYQCTDLDFKQKQRDFLAMIEDYLTNAQRLYFCYRGALTSTEWVGELERGQVHLYAGKLGAWAKIGEEHDREMGPGFWEKHFPPSRFR